MSRRPWVFRLSEWSIMRETAWDNRKSIVAAIVAMAVALMLSALVPARALAATDSIVDPTHDGSISITLKSSDNKAVGGTLAIYKVADVKTGSESGDTSGDNSYRFVWTDAYKSVDFDLSSKSGKLSDQDVKDILAVIKPVGNALDTKQVTTGTAVTFNTNIKPGLYLVVQTDVADGYDSIDPFLVSVPDSNLNYDVVATPKAGTVTKTTTTAKKTTSTPKATPSYTHSAAGKLPQTGQLWWPVWLMAAVGSVLLVTGLVVRNRSNQNSGPAKA